MSAPVIGAILAGGLARRMGGGDKVLRPLAGRPLLAHVVERLSPQCAALVLNANGPPERFSAYGLPVVADDVLGFQGPLAGILAALEAAAERWPAIPDVVTVPGDAPFLPGDLALRLARARAADGSVLACAASGGRSHPITALWPVALRGDLRRALMEENERAVGRFASRYATAIVAWPSDPVDPFFNANTPAELAQADAIARISAA